MKDKVNWTGFDGLSDDAKNIISKTHSKAIKSK
jgi:hypothetical protein